MIKGKIINGKLESIKKSIKKINKDIVNDNIYKETQKWLNVPETQNKSIKKNEKIKLWD